MVKGIIETVESKYEYRVRIPIYHKLENTPGAIPTEELPIAPVCTSPGVLPSYKKGDIVWVDFENDELGNPVITGLLYREDMKESTSDLKVDSIDVNVDANLPTSTQIGNVGEQSLQSVANINDTVLNLLSVGLVYRGILSSSDDVNNTDLEEGWYNIQATVPDNLPSELGNWCWSKFFVFKQNALIHQYLVKPAGVLNNGVLSGSSIALREYSGSPAHWLSWRTFSQDEYKALQIHRGNLLPRTTTAAGYQNIIHIKNNSATNVNAPIIFRVMDRNYTQYDIVLAFTNRADTTLQIQSLYCKGLNPKKCIAVCEGTECDLYVQKAEGYSVISVTDIYNNSYPSMSGLEFTFPNTYYGATAPSGEEAILINDVSDNNGLLVQNNSATWIGAQNTSTNNTIQIGVNATGIGGLYDRTHEKYIIQVPSGGSPVYYQSGVVSGTNKISGNEYIRTPLTKGQAPSANVYSSISFTDGTLGTATSNRLGLVECQAWTDGSTSMAIGPYRNVASSTTWSKFYFHTTSGGSATAFFPGNVIASHGLNASALVRAQNTSSNGAIDLLVDTAGNKGLYDRTNSAWILHKSSSGTLQIDQGFYGGTFNTASGTQYLAQSRFNFNWPNHPTANVQREIRALTANGYNAGRILAWAGSDGSTRIYLAAHTMASASSVSGKQTQFYISQPSTGGTGSALLYTNGSTYTMAHSGNIHSMFPVGSVLCMSTNSAPALGGTWTLIDKEFKTQYADKVSSIALNTTNTTSVAHVYTKWSGHTIQIAIDSLVNKVALADSTVTLFTMTPANFGVSSFGNYDLHFTSFSDAGQALITFNVAVNGAVQYLDGFVLKSAPTQGIPARTTTGRHVFTIIMSSYSHMADGYCDKFYFKRTA